jgi:hypothetical protein
VAAAAAPIRINSDHDDDDTTFVLDFGVFDLNTKTKKLHIFMWDTLGRGPLISIIIVTCMHC